MTFIKATISPIWYAPGTFWLWVEFDTGNGSYSWGESFASREQAEQAIIQARRNALTGQRYTILFYGAWYVIDEHSSRTFTATSIDDAVTHAETLNREVA